MSDTEAVRRDDPWQDLVVSMLAVNQYSLEKTYNCVDGLRKKGLFDPRNLALWDQAKISSQMKAAECDRGEFMTNLFAKRLSSLGQHVRQFGFAPSTELISRPNREAIVSFLSSVNGVGPKVLKNFFLLRGI